MRYFLELQYQGTRYHGWQAQNNAKSIQGIVNEVLSKVLREPIDCLGCGRTDTGVHAMQYFAHFDTEKEIPESFIRSLNGLLPKDIAILNLYPVAEEAHARFDAKLRTYRYYINVGKQAFIREHSTLLHQEPNIEKMNEVAKILLKTKDFASFCKAGGNNKTTICSVTHAQWHQCDTGWYFQISADRFLRNMVRAVVGTLLEVGQGKLSKKGFEDIIKSKDRKAAGGSVPAEGLFLWEIEY